MKNNPLSGLPVNVGKTEQLISLAAGAWLLYNSRLGFRSLPKAVLGGALLFRGGTGHCPLYKELGLNNVEEIPSVQVKTTLTVNKPPAEVYAYWRKLENLPEFMKHLYRVEETGDNRSVWFARIPGGLGTVKWESEIVSDIPNEHIAWESQPGSTIENKGSVMFVDAGDFGTEIHVDIFYKAPAGNLGGGVSKLFTPALERMIKEDIKNFRRIIETGELPTIECQPKG